MSKCYASAVLAIAAAEIGYHEKKSNSQLDNPTANAGSANYTKYARDFDEKYPKWYNGKKNGFAWCDMFVDWCMLTAFGYADALRLLCQPERSAGAGCTYSLMYYEKQGRYHAKDPKPGDQIFFSTAHSKSNVSHTGLVEKWMQQGLHHRGQHLRPSGPPLLLPERQLHRRLWPPGLRRQSPETPTRAARRRAAAPPAK